jgi:hypothetical protein
VTQRKALIVGIDTYEFASGLRGCVQDARAMAEVLARNKDGTKNFDCSVLLDRAEDGLPLVRSKLRRALSKLFDCNEDVLFYFSGHAVLAPTGGFLCTADATTDDWGVPMQELLDLAMLSPARQILLLLDCCYAGAMSNVSAPRALYGVAGVSMLRENMTVMAASGATGPATENASHGLFTSALIDGLNGGAADHMGFVSAPALYSYASRRFDAWDQRPVFKTHATAVFSLRQCEPIIHRLQLEQLPRLFPRVTDTYRLDPEYEPEDEAGNVVEPVNREKVAIAYLLKAYRDAGLLQPTEPNQQLYWVARRCGTVALTPRGREYWWLVVNQKI